MDIAKQIADMLSRFPKRTSNKKLACFQALVKYEGLALSYRDFKIVWNRIETKKERMNQEPEWLYYIPAPSQRFTPYGEKMGKLQAGDQVRIASQKKNRVSNVTLCDVVSILGESLGEIPRESLVSEKKLVSSRKSMANRLESSKMPQMASLVRSWGTVE